MGILINAIAGALHLLLAAVDIVLVFTLARCASRRWSNRFLVAFESAGRPLVDRVLEFIERQALRIHDGPLREGTKLGLCLFSLMLLRILAGELITWIR